MSAPGRMVEVVGRFEALRLLVLGDVMLDRYIWGSVERISPEAPVPVVRVERESTMLGGAGNVARTIASLGARAGLVALVGDDDAGELVADRLSDWKIDAKGVIVDPRRPTTQKTRVIAQAQQMVRFDRESDDPIPSDLARRLLEGVAAGIREADGVIVQDYGKGLLQDSVLEGVMKIVAERALPVFIDPKGGDWGRFRGAELVKPNQREAEAAAGMRIRCQRDVEICGSRLLEQTGARTLAITRGGEGMSFVFEDGRCAHFAGRRRPVAEASGAGDTAIATLALARLAGGRWSEAAALANAAAGLVVSVPGTAAISARDLLEAVSP
ncbi:MAG: bifunctional heptose 7-phosphate kinase/heptose 1-phosphate adenyltransferase [Myxococcota bacterium]